MIQRRWPTQLSVYSYAQQLVIGWQIADRSREATWNEYEQALELYLSIQDANLADDERQRRLLGSRDRFQALADKGDRHIGVSTALMRINFELGDPRAMLNAIEQLLDIMPWMAEPLPRELEIQINRPFLAPLPRFDQDQVLDGDLGQWIQAGIMAALETADTALTTH